MQLLFSNTAALLLGRKWGCVPTLLYLLCGIVGLPVFSCGGGISCFSSPTFGFILGFLPGALACGVISERISDKRGMLLGSIANLLCVYLCGTLYYLLYLPDRPSLSYALLVCVVPFIIPDAIKCTLSILLASMLKMHTLR